jgi:Pyruvate/2-oxoacid:ferredoxin oxidoreductase delta subunit
MVENSEAEIRKPVYKHKKSLLGISDWIVDKFGVRPYSWKFILKVFKLIVSGSKYMEKPVLGPIYNRLMKFTPVSTTYSHGTILNLNVDVSKEGESMTLPIDLVKDMLRNASYIASANACICRDANSCSNFPKEVCCLFLSNSGKTVVDHKVGYEISLENALQRVDKAAEMGLVGQALWVEVEQYIWGFSNADMEHFLEMCFCCSCCCVGFNVSRNASRDVKKRFHSSSWTAVIDGSKCTGCGECIKPCPQACITLNENSIAVNNIEYCVGCGICKNICKPDAIRIKQTKPMLASVQEYFLEDGRLNIHI